MTIITENDWKCFCEEWGGTEENGISAIIELCSSNDLAECCGGMPMCEQPLDLPNEVNNENESRQPVIRTCPEVIFLKISSCYVIYVMELILI